MLQFLVDLWERLTGSVKLGGAKRSGQWPRVRKEHLAKNPLCAVCGKKGKLLPNEAHHIQVFNKHPELELSPENIITLCRKDHLIFGHLNNFSSWNEKVREDAEYFRKKIEKRP